MKSYVWYSPKKFTEKGYKVPTTWAELEKDCAIAKANKIDCYAGQFAQYEGLTVNVAEAINSAGGKFLSDDGKSVAVDTPEARAGLEVRVRGGGEAGQVDRVGVRDRDRRAAAEVDAEGEAARRQHHDGDDERHQRDDVEHQRVPHERDVALEAEEFHGLCSVR